MVALVKFVEIEIGLIISVLIYEVVFRSCLVKMASVSLFYGFWGAGFVVFVEGLVELDEGFVTLVVEFVDGLVVLAVVLLVGLV